MKIVLLVELALTNALLKLFLKVISTWLIPMFAPIAALAPKFVLQKQFIRLNIYRKRGKKADRNTPAGLSFGVPCMAVNLVVKVHYGGLWSPTISRGQGCPPWSGIWRKLKAKFRPEEHESYQAYPSGRDCKTSQSPKITRTSGCKYGGDMEWKLTALPREVSRTCGNGLWSMVKTSSSWEVSRSHSTTSRPDMGRAEP